MLRVEDLLCNGVVGTYSLQVRARKWKSTRWLRHPGNVMRLAVATTVIKMAMNTMGMFFRSCQANFAPGRERRDVPGVIDFTSWLHSPIVATIQHVLRMMQRVDGPHWFLVAHGRPMSEDELKTAQTACWTLIGNLYGVSAALWIGSLLRPQCRRRQQSFRQ